jgi:cytochrome P450
MNIESARQAPGPPGKIGLRNVYAFAKDTLGLLRDLTDRYGDVAQMRVLGTPWFLINHPDDIETVMVKNARHVGRDAYTEILERTLGLGLLTSDGELWKRQRKLMSQAFTPKRIGAYAETMVEVTDRGLGWGDGEVFNLHAEMSRLTMEVVARVLFGTGLERAEIDLVHDSMEMVNAFYANSPEAILRLPPWVPTPRNRALAGAVAQIDGLIFHIIAERRRAASRSDDLLGTLLAAVDEGGGMSDKQLRDEAITLFLAGHETTALTLAHALYLVSQYPEVGRRLATEIERALGSRPPTASDLPRLAYVEWVIKEAMRLYPPAWTTGREALEDLTVAGFCIPKGAQILMSQWIVHRDPRWFSNPEAFDPDRWAPAIADRLPRYAYFPFGGGPRVCIGNHFAMMEAILLLTMIVQRYQVELLPRQTLEVAPSVTLRPRGPGLMVRARRRPPVAIAVTA